MVEKKVICCRTDSKKGGEGRVDDDFFGCWCEIKSKKRKGYLSDYNTRLLLFEHSVKVDMILKQVNRELGEYIFCFFFSVGGGDFDGDLESYSDNI